MNLYVRQSLDATGEGVAVARQEAECREHAAAHGLEIVETFADNDVSATSGKARPGFEAVLAAGLDVLVWHQDRLVRVSKDLERVLDAGVNVHSVKAGTLDLSNPTGRAVARTVTAWATYEGEHKAERQRAAHRQRVAAGRPWWPVAPFGYEKDGTPSADAPLVAQAYEDLLSGKTIAAITRDWTEAGTLSPRGKAWIRTSVLQVLKSPRNAGLMEYKGEITGRGAWEPLVEEGTWSAAQAVLADPQRGKGGGSRRHWLTGVARCGIEGCGRGLVAHWQGKRPHQYQSHRCPSGHLSIKTDWLAEWVTEAVQRPVDPSAGPAFRHPTSTPEMDRLGDEAAALRDRLDQIGAAAADGLPMAVVLKASADIERRLAENLAALQALAAEGPVYAGTGTWPEMTDEQRRSYVRGTYDVVVLPIPARTRREPESVVVTPR